MLSFGIQNINCTLVLTSKTLNMLCGTLFVVCVLVNRWFVLFFGILICNRIRGTYLVAVYLLSKLDAACMFVYNHSQPESCFFLPFSLLKCKSNISSCLKISEYMSQTLLYALQPLKTSPVHSFLNFNLKKHQLLLILGFQHLSTSFTARF